MLDEGSRQHGLAHGGANALLFYCSAPLTLTDFGFAAGGQMRAGERLSAMATSLSHYTPTFAADDDWASQGQIDTLFARTIKFWQEWSSRCTFREDDGDGLRDQLVRSALTLKALTYEPSGAIVAAATTGLPGGSAANATGTIGLPGFATRPSRSPRCSTWVSPTRRRGSRTGSSGRSPTLTICN